MSVINPVSTYPWKSRYITRDEINERFNNLKEYEPKFVEETYEIRNIRDLPDKLLMFSWGIYSSPILLIQKPEYYTTLNEITDFWVEPIRALATRKDGVSLMSHWCKNHQNIKGSNPYEIRENLYKSIGVEVGTFRPSVITAIIKLFNSKRVLDPCAGWGDRLVGSMASNINSYTGVDPNSRLRPCYWSMVSQFSEMSETDVNIITSPFENADIKGSFDLVFTSPPYFDLEIYSKDSNQSTFKFSTLEEWRNNFLFVLLAKAWSVLEFGGKMAININNYFVDKERVNYIEAMLEHVKTYEDCSYLGCISYCDENRRSPQPIWIWEKFRSRKIVVTIKYTEREGEKFKTVATTLTIFQISSTVIEISRKDSKSRERVTSRNIDEICHRLSARGEKFLKAFISELPSMLVAPSTVELSLVSQDLRKQYKEAVTMNGTSTNLDEASNYSKILRSFNKGSVLLNEL